MPPLFSEKGSTIEFSSKCTRFAIEETKLWTKIETFVYNSLLDVIHLYMIQPIISKKPENFQLRFVENRRLRKFSGS